MDELLMKRNGRYIGCLCGVDNNTADRRIRVTMCPGKADGISAGGDISELILASPEGYGVQGVGAADSGNESICAKGQHCTLDLSHYLVVEYGEEGVQIELAIPENNGAGEVEVQPEFEFVVGDIGHVGAADIDREIIIGAENDQRIRSGAIGIYFIA